MAASYRIRKTKSGQYVAIVRFDAGGPGPASVGAAGNNERQALARAAILAKAISQSPIFAAVAPPGTAAAIKAISFLAKSKDVQAALARFRGPGARRLGKMLSRFW